MLKNAFAGAVVQVRPKGCEPFPDGGGIDIRHRFGVRIPMSVRRMVDFWDVASLPAPRTGRDRGVKRIVRW